MSKTAKWIISIIVIILIIAEVWYYGAKPANTPAETGLINIGAILSLTGNQTDIGQSMRQGAEMAQEEINSIGSGSKLNILSEDGQNDPKAGLSAYRKLSDVDGIKIFLVAHSNVSRAVAEVAQKENGLVFSIYTIAPTLTQIGDRVFLNEINTINEINKLVEYAELKKYKTAATLVVNTEGSLANQKIFKGKFESDVGRIVVEEKYNATENDFRTQLTKIKAGSPDVIFIMASPKQMGLILKQKSELGINAPILSTFHTEGADLLKVAGSLAEGIIYTHTVDLVSSNPVVKSFADKFRAKYNKEPDYFGAEAYDSVKILYSVSKNCLGGDVACVKNNLVAVKNFPAVTGLITINNNRETDKTIILKTVKNGQFVPLNQ